MTDPFVSEEITYKTKDLLRVIAGSDLKLTVDPNGHGDFTDPQDAIDAAPLGSNTAIEVNPGIYTGNFVNKRGVFLHSGGFGFGGAKDVILRSASGDTLQIPHRDSGAIGITVQSSGPNPTDVATRVIDDGGGAGLETFCLNYFTESMPGAQAQALHGDALPPNENAIFIYCGVDADASAPIAMELDASFLVWFLGGMGGNGAQTGIKMNPGSGLMLGAQVGVNADLTAGRVIDADGGFVLCLDCTIDGFHGIRGQNGSTIVLGKIQSFGGMLGTPLDTDVTSAVFLGSEVLEGFGGTSWQNFSVLGPSLRVWKGTEGGGSTGLVGPDQRPTVGGNNVPLGFRYTATDITIGTPGVPGTGGDLIYFPGVGWKDAANAIHP